MDSLALSLLRFAGPKPKKWSPGDGLMKYAEVKIGDVRSGEFDLERVRGYLFSQKYDGWHAVWDGEKTLFSKGGVPFPSPADFLKKLPKGVPLSGELVLPGEQATSVASLTKGDSEGWEIARFYAFDAPGERSLPFSERTKKVEEAVKSAVKRERQEGKGDGKGDGKPRIRYVRQRVLDPNTFLKVFDDIVECRGEFASDSTCFGEGVVVTDPSSLYVAGRASQSVRFKVKKVQDDEAVVLGHHPPSDPTSLRVRLTSSPSSPSVDFKLGIGIKDSERKDLVRSFPVGTIVKFSFRSKSAKGVPKEARLIGRREKADM